ncbi:MAG: hypothetical protein HY716_18740 [Planctomycetes bacterium]|nr:hypothetical protein [Planctomycetota bacterium]
MSEPYPALNGSAASASEAHRRVGVFASLRRHKLAAFLMVVLVAAAAAPLLLHMNRPTYTAEALLLVSPTAKNLAADRESQLPRYQEFLNQQLLMLAREDVALEALDRLGDRRSVWQRPGESLRDAAGRLSASLVTARVPETLYITVALEGDRPEGLIEIVNAVVDAYLERNRGPGLYGAEGRTDVLQRRVAELKEEIRAKTDRLARWAKDLGIAGLESETIPPVLQEAELAMREAQARTIRAEASLAGLAARQEILETVDPGFEARNQLAADVELTGIRTVLLARKAELKGKLLGLTNEHEGRRAIEAAMAEIDIELERAEKETLERLRDGIVHRHEARMKEERLALQAELDQAKRYEQSVTEKAGALIERTVRVYPEVQGLRQDVDRLRRQLAAVQDRIDSMRLETQSPGYVHVVAPASLAETPPWRRLLKWAGAFAALALFLAFAVPVLLEISDRRVQNSADIEGAVLSLPDWKRRGGTFVEDQVRRLALLLERERRLNQRTRVVFTSARSGGGTSQLVLDVARELGTLGVRALAVEVNALKPDRRFAGPNGQHGLADALAGAAPMSSVVVPADDRFPDRVATGAAADRTNLAHCGNLDAQLRQVADRYDMILIDAPPLLLSADAEYLASWAGGVVLIVEAARTSLADVERANKVLRQAGANVLMTVVNRVRIWSEAGSFAKLMREHERAARQKKAAGRTGHQN